jgi:glycosyltransferase involved in cell wall biosynthesis
MRASIVISSLNEAERLWKTVRSVLASTKGLDYELVIADDASSDDTVAELLKRYPDVRVVAHKKRKGCSPTKDLGARSSKGDVIVFLDGHCKPERGAIEKLVADVESQDGEAILTPAVLTLDAKTWTSSRKRVGQCYFVELVDFDCNWTGITGMWMRGGYYESPALCGCCFAVSRWLYEKLRGFDPHMREWGIEDVDLSLKAWLMGYSVLFDASAMIGHRFRRGFDTFSVSDECVAVNKLRMARKNFSDPVWNDWLRKFRARQPKKRWETAWGLFREHEKSAERERKYLQAHRKHDEFWYARRFGLDWPKAPRNVGRRR